MGALTVSEITGRVDEAARALDTYDPRARCSALAPDLPPPELLELHLAEPAHHVLVVTDAGTRVGLALVRESRIRWLLADRDRYVEVVQAIVPWVVARYGECWGQVHNPELRALLLEESTGYRDSGAYPDEVRFP